MGRGKYITVTACATPTDPTSPKRTQVHPDNMAAKTVNRHEDLIKRTEQPGIEGASQCGTVSPMYVFQPRWMQQQINSLKITKYFVHFNEPNYQ